MARIFPFSRETQDYLTRRPEPGGCHIWLFNVALRLRDHLGREALRRWLRSEADIVVTHRAVSDKEIEDCLDKVYAEKAPEEVVGTGIKWPKRDAALVVDVLKEFEGFALEEVAAGADVLPALFGREDLVCFGADKFNAQVRSVEEAARHAEYMQFIVATPAEGTEATSRQGRRSARCAANFKRRRFVIAEFDGGESKEEQTRLLQALSCLAPLKLVVDSGGKSLHGWFDLAGWKESAMVEHFGRCAVLGADISRWDICGWVRMPGGLREGRRQKIVWWKA